MGWLKTLKGKEKEGEKGEKGSTFFSGGSPQNKTITVLVKKSRFRNHDK